MKHILAALLMCVNTVALAQTSVRQSGNVTPGHAVRWTSTGVIQDAGTAQSGSLTSLGVTNNGGPGICVNSAATTGPYNQLCLATTTNGGSKISSYTYGGATTPGITFDINGTQQGFLTVQGAVAVNDFACFADTTGNIKSCGTLALPIPVATGGTGRTSLTNHAVLLGQGAGAIAFVGPGTSGIPLIGQGASADPVFGTAIVGGGGTGATSFTANGVLYGNSTSAVQVTAQGAANSVLIANAGAPSFSAAPTIGTSVTTPIVYGGSGTSATLTLQGTSSGSPSGDSVIVASGSKNIFQFIQNPGGDLGGTYVQCWPGNTVGSQNAECDIISSLSNAGWSFRMKGTGVFEIHGPTDNSQSAAMCLAENQTNGTNRVCFFAAASIGTDFSLIWPNAVPGSTSPLMVASNGAMSYASGLSATVSVRKGDDSGACNLVVTNGIVVSTTC